MTDIEARARELVRGFPTSLAEEHAIKTLLQMHTAALRDAREAALKEAAERVRLYFDFRSDAAGVGAHLSAAILALLEHPK